jgi:hypothetical protein
MSTSASREELLLRPWAAVQPPDDGAAAEKWCARRLHELEREQGAAAPGEGAADNDASRWDEARVAKWLNVDVGLGSSVGAAAREQGMRGEDLLGLEDEDLLVLGVASAAERRRVARRLDELHLSRRLGARAAGTGKAALLARKQRLNALLECVEKVLANCPTLPLRSRRLVRSLWSQQAAVAAQAIGRIEHGESVQRARDARARAKVWESARRLLEAQMVLRAEGEDREARLQAQLAKERARADSFEAMAIVGEELSGVNDALMEERAETKRLRATLMSSFKTQHDERAEAVLGERFLEQGRELAALVENAELEGAAQDRVLEEAEAVASSLRGQEATQVEVAPE